LLDYFLFIVYMLLFCWLLTRSRFIRNSGIEKKWITILFLVRVGAGILNLLVSIYYYGGSDSTTFEKNGLDEYNVLIHHPLQYFKDIFYNPHNNNYGGFFNTSNSYWNDLKNNIINKFIAVLNIFSHCNYFINALIYNFLIFFASFLFYRVFIKVFPGNKWPLIVTCFLLPSMLYFTAEIHREGFIFLACGLVFYNTYALVNGAGKKFIRCLAIGVSLFFILLLRNFVLITILPALLSWIIAKRYRFNSALVFSSFFSLFILLFFMAGKVNDKINLPKYVVERQQAFIDLSYNSGSALPTTPLNPTPISFMRNIPEALNHSLLRPYITEAHNFLSIASGIELLVYEIMLLLLIFFFKRSSGDDTALYFSLFFGLSMLLVIGYTVPVAGAIARYRCIYLPLLLSPVVCCTSYTGVLKRLNINI
jgi:hypothetical protein